MQTVIVVIHLMIVIAMIGVVLLQKSEGGGLGMGGGGAGGFLSSRGTANVLTRTTALLALGFFLTSIALSFLAGLDRRPTSILPNVGPTSGAPAPPGAPGSLPPLDQGGGGGLLNNLGGQPAAPPAGQGTPPPQ